MAQRKGHQLAREGSRMSVGHLWLLALLVVIVAAPTWVMVRRARSSPTRRTASMLASSRECRACKEFMRRDASVCPHCRTASEPWTYKDGHWWVTRDDGRRYYLDEPSGAWKLLELLAPPN